MPRQFKVEAITEDEPRPGIYYISPGVYIREIDTVMVWDSDWETEEE